MIRLMFAQNLSKFSRAFNKMLGKVYLLPTFPSKCCFICLLGSYFYSLNALFGSPVWGNVCERPFCLFTPGEVLLERCKKFPRFSNFNLLIQKNGKFWSVCTVFDRKRKNTENGKSIKRNLNFVKQRNGGLTIDFSVSETYHRRFLSETYHRRFLSLGPYLGSSLIRTRLAQATTVHFNAFLQALTMNSSCGDTCHFGSTFWGNSLAEAEVVKLSCISLCLKRVIPKLSLNY